MSEEKTPAEMREDRLGNLDENGEYPLGLTGGPKDAFKISQNNEHGSIELYTENTPGATASFPAWDTPPPELPEPYKISAALSAEEIEKAEKAELESLLQELNEHFDFVSWESRDSVFLEGHFNLVEVQKIARAFELRSKYQQP